ncbi:MAG: TetR/AcrR family transcriptional regulator [Roseibium aggregatum]
MDGPAGLTIEALCTAADRTRGSFYHHFQDHGAFVEALMLAWKQRHTLDIAEQALAEKGDLRARKLSDLANRLDHRLEQAVRQFAQSDLRAQEIVRDVDDLRTGFVARLYEAGGMEPALAADVAKIEYAAFVGSQIVWPDMPADERFALDRRFAQLVAMATETGSRK